MLAIVLAGCGGGEEVAVPAPEADLAGSWRAVLESPGGELPFTLRIDRDREGNLSAVAINGREEAPLGAVERDGSRVRLDCTWYDSAIEAELGRGGQVLTGRWEKVGSKGVSALDFRAERGDERRFLPLLEAGLLPIDSPRLPNVSGAWAVALSDDEGTQPARAELTQRGPRVTGTFLTPTGDYRYLDGRYERGVLRLSTFDGAHAFLFEARSEPGGTLAGDFWSRDSYHATWTARRVGQRRRAAAAGAGDGEAGTGSDGLPDPWELVVVTSDDGRFRFAFPDLAGETVGWDDPRFAGKVVVVNLFGSWCPNCNDEAPLLARWDRRWRDRGLEVVGLAYELTGEAERDRRQVGRFAERHGVEYPLLLAGTSDKAAAAATLPDLDRVVAYPTSIFIGRDGRVRKVHSGFAGPGTGAHHAELVAELEAVIEELLAEPAPDG